MSSNERKPVLLSEILDEKTGVRFVYAEHRPHPQNRTLAQAVQELAEGLLLESRERAESVVPRRASRLAARLWRFWGRRSWLSRVLTKRKARREIFRRVILAIMEEQRTEGDR